MGTSSDSNTGQSCVSQGQVPNLQRGNSLESAQQMESGFACSTSSEEETLLITQKVYFVHSLGW